MPRYTEDEAREAVAVSESYSEVLRRLGMRPAGGNHALLKKYVDEVWKIPTDHFDPGAAASRHLHSSPRPLVEVLVRGSNYSRGHLKQRLFKEGLKERRCEMCCQDENWHGRRMGLILDHVNGIPDDNRIANLRIVCPNCAATLDTHCGRKNRIQAPLRACRRCGREFAVKYRQHRYCSRSCGMRWDRSSVRGKQRGLRGVPTLGARKVERPPYEQLVSEIDATSYLAVGRKYGVSDNAVRKWVRFYERQHEREEAESKVAIKEG